MTTGTDTGHPGGPKNTARTIPRALSYGTRDRLTTTWTARVPTHPATPAPTIITSGTFKAPEFEADLERALAEVAPDGGPADVTADEPAEETADRAARWLEAA